MMLRNVIRPCMQAQLKHHLSASALLSRAMIAPAATLAQHVQKKKDRAHVFGSQAANANAVRAASTLSANPTLELCFHFRRALSTAPTRLADKVDIGSFLAFLDDFMMLTHGDSADPVFPQHIRGKLKRLVLADLREALKQVCGGCWSVVEHPHRPPHRPPLRHPFCACAIEP